MENQEIIIDEIEMAEYIVKELDKKGIEMNINLVLAVLELEIDYLDSQGLIGEQ